MQKISSTTHVEEALKQISEQTLRLCKSRWRLETMPAAGDTFFSPRPLPEALDAYKKRIVSRVLEQTGGNQPKPHKTT